MKIPMRANALGLGMFAAGGVTSLAAGINASNNGRNGGNTIAGLAGLGMMGYGGYANRKMIGKGMTTLGRSMGGKSSNFIGPQTFKNTLGSRLRRDGSKFSRL